MDVLPEWLSSTVASDATAGTGVLGPEIRALSPEATVAGPALVVTLSRDDNLAMKEVPAAVPGPGTVLVVTCASESRTAVLGDLVARELLRAGELPIHRVAAECGFQSYFHFAKTFRRLVGATPRDYRAAR